MSNLTAHQLPAVHSYETDDELVVEIELPAAEPWIKTELREHTLRLTISLPAKHPAWEPHADATPS